MTPLEEFVETFRADVIGRCERDSVHPTAFSPIYWWLVEMRDEASDCRADQVARLVRIINGKTALEQELCA